VRILVTGATGFVGRWLIRDLGAAGHDAVGTPPSSELDVTNQAAVAAFVASVRPDAIAHLAAVSYGPDARREPERAFEINEGGTRAVLSAAQARMTPVLVVSSSEVYGVPAPEDLPLREGAPLRANQPYGLSKVAAERAVLEPDWGLPVVVVRAFNHTGPGQRRDFVVPALAARIALASLRGEWAISAGNVDVLRDFCDVRDVVRAYRLVVEALAAGDLPAERRIYNVASGRAVAIREIVETLAAIAGIDVAINVDPALVRSDDPPEIRGDASLIATDLGWGPAIPLDITLRDVMREIQSESLPGT
jgi:GDP-4-dehydro-6-deoxy-D-mannose reductase